MNDPPSRGVKFVLDAPPLINAPCLMDPFPQESPKKNKETLHRVKSRNLFSFLLVWLAMACELHPVQSQV